MRVHAVRATTVAAIAALAVPATAAAQTWGQYGVNIIEFPTAFHLAGWHVVNNAGQVAGYFVDGAGYNWAARFDGGSSAPVLRPVYGLPPDSYATAINEAGDITGYQHPRGSSIYQSFVEEAGGIRRPLPSWYGNTVANDINEAGLIVGSDGPQNGSSQAMLIRDYVSLQRLPYFGSSSTATSVNNQGWVAGHAQMGSTITRAFLSPSGGGGQILGTLGGNSSYAYDLNDAGQVVGYADLSGNSLFHAYLYSGGVMQDLGEAGSNSFAYSMDSSGRVVGGASSGASVLFRAALWESTGSGYQQYLLDDIVNDGAANSGWSFEEVRSISEDGRYMVAYGRNGTGYDGWVLLEENGVPATVTPEPITMALLGSGLAGIGGMRLRRRRKEPELA